MNCNTTHYRANSSSVPGDPTITLLVVGTCTLQGVQAGNANFAAAPTVTVSFQVTPPGAVAMSSSMNPANYRSLVVLTADITGTNPTGTVSFFQNGSDGSQTVICSQVALVNARATCPIPPQLMVTSIMSFSGVYSGDGTNPSNTQVFQQLVNTNAVSLTVATKPVQPVVGGSVTLRATVAATSLAGKVTFFENGTPLTGCSQLTVTPLPGATNIGVAACTINNLTAGLHNYVVNYPHTADQGFEQVIVPVTPLANFNPTDFTDMWWNAAQNGWGASITQHGRNQFIVLFVYDTSGNPIWYVLPEGTWNASNTTFTGALYQPTSAPFGSYLTSAFRPLGATGAPVGTLSVTYTGTDTATMNYTINGITASKSITRQAFAVDDNQPKLQVGDMYWGGIEQNGWGINIAQQGRVLFPVWYTYDSQGRTVFYAIPGGTWTGSSFTGDIYTTMSSPWLGVNYNPAQFVVTKVGTMTLDFADQSNAVMTYTVGNTTQRKVITRQPY